MLHDNILEHVGNTPLVRADRIAKEYGLKCNLFCKCEYFNAGGSVKDRIAKRMIEEAEKDGRLVRGKSVIVEPTSGNTGIGLALAAAVYGYRCIICLPEKMSQEKQTVLQALGAEVIRTPTEAAYDDPRSHIQVAWRLQREIPNAVVLDQYSNTANPLAHYDGTAVEIIEDIRKTAPAVRTRSRGNTLDKLVNGSGMMAGFPRNVPAEVVQEEGTEGTSGSGLSQSPKATGRPRGNTLDRLINGSTRLEGCPTTIPEAASDQKQASPSSDKENQPASGESSPDAKRRPRGNTMDRMLRSSGMLNGLPTTTRNNNSSSGPTSNGNAGESSSAAPAGSGKPRPSSGRVDVLVAGAGTGGSISGLSKRLKEEWSDTLVVGIDPIGSILAQPESLNELKEGESPFYKVEGIGYEFIPQVLDRSLVDVWKKVNDDRSFKMTQKLIRLEGLLVGGSSGCAMAGAMDFLLNTAEGKAIACDETKNVVVIMPDSIRNYITKPWLLTPKQEN